MSSNLTLSAILPVNFCIEVDLGNPSARAAWVDGVLDMDSTGAVAPGNTLFQQEGLEPVGVQIHGGDKASHEGESWRVPKRDLVGVLQVLLQTERLKVAGKLKLGPVLSQEMLNFRVLIDPVTAHDSYSAWREADHDDLVLSVALASWWGENGPKDAPVMSPGVVKRRSKWRRGTR